MISLYSFALLKYHTVDTLILYPTRSHYFGNITSIRWEHQNTTLHVYKEIVLLLQHCISSDGNKFLLNIKYNTNH